MGCVFSCVTNKKKKKRRKGWTKQDVQSVYGKTSGKCYLCDKNIGPCERRKGRWHIDHVECFAEHGNGSWKGWAPACQSCNLRKGKMSVIEFHRRVLGTLPRCQFISSDWKMCPNRCSSSDSLNCGHHWWETSTTTPPTRLAIAASNKG
jgi:hypothetical protein